MVIIFLIISVIINDDDARLVGLEVARLVEILRTDPAKVHIIGHSLGAHIAGYAGERIKGEDDTDYNDDDVDDVFRTWTNIRSGSS